MAGAADDHSPRVPRTKVARLDHARAVGDGLARAIPNPKCELDHRNAFELLIATILSAQSTDKGVNRVTPTLFAKYPTPRALADAPQDDVERIIHATGFFRAKAKNIRAASARLADEHAGEVPRSMDQLIRLPGVARKTAAVVLGTAFGIAEGIPVDTHATRVTHRLGLTRQRDPAKIERELMELFPREGWPDLGHRIVLHGRYTCIARKPKCAECGLLAICPAREARTARANRGTVEAARA